MEDFQKIVESNKYFKSYDKFLEEHPEIDPEWREFMEPVIMDIERRIFSFMITLQ